MDDQAAYKRSKKRVAAKIGFYIHLAAYVGVNLLLIAIYLMTSGENFWFKWPLMGWGIGLLFHAFAVFALPSGPSIRERMIQKEMEKESSKK